MRNIICCCRKKKKNDLNNKLENNSKKRKEEEDNSKFSINIKEDKSLKVNNYVITADKINQILHNNSENQKTEKYESLKFSFRTFIKGKKYEELTKDYELLENLGEGSYGIVQKVRHKESGQIRAMKVFKRYSDSFAISIKEIENLLRLDHPNIIKMFEYYYDQYNFYMIMEFCNGGELFDKVKEKGGKFKEEEAAIIMRTILKAVAYCHSKKIVHRDLKLENILFKGKKLDNLKIIDFGTGSLLRENEIFKERIGTAYYIAPEVINRKYNEKCDMWSLGVILYILLSGKPPFNGNNEGEIINAIKYNKINFNIKELKNVSMLGMDLLQKLLKKNPENRLSASQALSHPWIKAIENKIEINLILLKKVFDNLLNFNAKRKLQQAVFTYIANQLLTEEEIIEAKKIFIELDSTSDGLLSKDELKFGLLKFYSETEATEKAEEIMKKVDADENGFLEYDEFLRASVDKDKILNESRLHAAFSLFDKNNDGQIDTKELKAVLSDGIPELISGTFILLSSD